MTDSEKRKKKLVKYLADYIEHEMEDNTEFDSWQEMMESAIDVFESVENMEVFVV